MVFYTRITCSLLLILGSSFSYNHSYSPFADNTHIEYKDGDVTVMNSAALLAKIPSITQKNIVFDLTGVLFHPSKKFLLFQAGVWNLLWYGITHLKNPLRIFETALLTLISEIEGVSDEHFYKEYPLPEIVCKWQRGEITCKQILEHVQKKITEWDEAERFSSDLEKEIVQKIIHVAFTPEEFARKSFKPIESGIALLQACAQRRAAGEPIQIYLLSNFEKETLEVMKQIHADIFNLFDGIAVSGNLGVMKPDQEAFSKFATHFGLNPQECLFIDDQKENIQAAQKAGMTAIQFLE